MFTFSKSKSEKRLQNQKNNTIKYEEKNQEWFWLW